MWRPVPSGGTHILGTVGDECVAPTTTTTTTGGPITIYSYAVACNSYTWDVTGDTYFDSDEISYTVGNVTNILYLTICPVPGTQTETQTVTAVSPYIWPINGQTYTASGSYSYTLPCGDGGCTYFLELTIIDPTTTTTTIPPTTTTTTTIAPTTTTTTTSLGYLQSFSAGFADSATACLETTASVTLYTDTPTVSFSSSFYTDSGLTTPFIGGSLWYRQIPGANSWQISNTGDPGGQALC